MQSNVENSGRTGRVMVAFFITLLIGGVAWGFQKAGLFGQIGPVPTGSVLAADAFVVVLIWWRAVRP